MLGDIDAGPVVVYGILDSSYEEMLDEEWLSKNFEDISVFFYGVSDGGYGNPIYGYELTLDETTGLLSKVTEKMKSQIAKLHSIIEEHRQLVISKVKEWEKDRFAQLHSVYPPYQRRDSDNPSTIGYYAAISDINGDIEDKYIPEIY